MGNLTQVTEPAPEGGTHLTTYAYNLYNQLTTVTMPRSTGTQTRAFNYDLNTARLTSVTNPESGTVTFAYNPDGTLLSKTDAKGQKIQYGYDTAGLRLWKQSMTDSVIRVYYNGLDGKPLADFYLSGSVQGGDPMVYFAGKRVDNVSVEDRLGTAVAQTGQSRKFFPYGELRSDPVTGLQFATYQRDSTTNFDYAHQRYYSSQIARFTTPDPNHANTGGTGDPAEPQSWNRYTYVGGDPVNFADPEGLVKRVPDCGPNWIRSGLSCVPSVLTEDFVFGTVGRLVNSEGQSDRLAASAELRDLQRRWAAAMATTKAMRQELATLLNTLANSNCAKVLNEWRGYTIEDLQSVAGNITYFLTSGQEGQLTLSDFMPDGTYPLSQAGTTLKTVTDDAWRDSNAAAVVLSDASNTTASQGALPDVLFVYSPGEETLWHEFWHAGLGLSDQGAVNTFDIPRAEGQSASDAFDAWLGKDCGKE